MFRIFKEKDAMESEKKSQNLILASQSPERLRLIQQLVSLENLRVEPAHLDETPRFQEHPKAYVSRVAQEKSAFLACRYPDAFVIGADTIVAVGRRILRKATSPQEARDQIQLISGRRHRVYTALSLYVPHSKKFVHRLAMAHVSFKRLSSEEIDLFIGCEEWKNVASYKIQGVAGRWIRSVQGLSTTIQGLPIYPLYQLLQGNGFPVLQPEG
jgi:septum formation protein